MNVEFPFHIDDRGRTAEASDEDHIKQMMEQILFTSPGERVNRPTFGSGVKQLVFAPNNEALAAATQVAVQSALQQWLGNLIEVGEVQVTNVDSTLTVLIRYLVRSTQETRVTQFTRIV